MSDFDDYKKVCDSNIYKYIPPIIGPKSRIIAIGDLHGDYKLTIRILRDVAKVIDNHKNWIGGETVVVQVGDQIDRCRAEKCDEDGVTKDDEASDEKILMFMTELDKQARKSNGMVISLLGNHELLNASGNMNYVSRKGLLQYGNTIEEGRKKRIQLFSPGNRLGTFMGCSRVSFVIIGSFIFVHGGITKKIMDKLMIRNNGDLVKVNHIIRKWLTTDMERNGASEEFNSWLRSLISVDNIDKIINGGIEGSMFWSRIFGNLGSLEPMDSKVCHENLKPVLKTLKLKGMIIGHTPQPFAKHTHAGINSTCDNAVWRIDVAASRAFDLASSESENEIRRPQCLEILNDGKEFNVLV